MLSLFCRARVSIVCVLHCTSKWCVDIVMHDYVLSVEHGKVMFNSCARVSGVYLHVYMAASKCTCVYRKSRHRDPICHKWNADAFHCTCVYGQKCSKNAVFQLARFIVNTTKRKRKFKNSSLPLVNVSS